MNVKFHETKRNEQQSCRDGSSLRRKQRWPLVAALMGGAASGCASPNDTQVNAIGVADAGQSDIGNRLAIPSSDVMAIDNSPVAEAPRNVARGLRRRLRVAKDGPPARADALWDQLVVKFVDGAGLRVRAGAVIQDNAPRTADDLDRLGAYSITQEQATREGAAVRQMLANERGARLIHFVDDEVPYQQIRANAEQSIGHELADMTTHFTIRLPRVDRASAEDLLRRLRTSPLIEFAYAQPLYTTPRATAPCVDQAPPTTSAMADAANQIEHDQPPSGTNWNGLAPGALIRSGHDVRFAWNVTGGRGSGTLLYDVEYGFNEEHEDLPDIPVLTGGFNNHPPGFSGDIAVFHGTSAFGVAVGCNNGFGFTGIASQASAYWSGTTVADPNAVGGRAFNSGASITRAAIHSAQLGRVILVEIVGAQPVEVAPAEFNAIQNATAAGAIVIEPTGNSSGNLETMTAGGAPFVARLPGDPAFSGAIVVGAVMAEADINGRHNGVSWSGGGSRVDLAAWGSSANSVILSAAGHPFGQQPTPANQWYENFYNGTSGASAFVAGVMLSVYGMALANSGSSFFTGWDLRTLVWRTGIPSFPTADAQQRAIGPNVQLGMAAAVFGDRTIATNVGDSFTSVGTTSAQAIVHLYGQKATGVWAQNVFQGGAWHGWNSFPAYANGTQKLKLLDSSSGTTTTIDAWALDSAGWLIWSKRANIAPTTNFQAFAQQDTTVLQSITPLAFYPGYVNGFGVTATGQLKWYYRPVGATTVYAGSLTIPTPTTLASAIVAVGNDNPGSPKVFMFARNTSGQLVYGWSDGGSFFGWTVLNPAETDVTSVDAVLHHEGVMVAAGRGTSTRLGRLNLSNGTWSWSSVPVASPFSVSLTSFEGDAATNVNSVRLTANNFLGGVQSATIYQLNSWVIPSASWWTTWNVVNTSAGLSTTPYRNGEWMTFTIAPNGIPLFRVIDPRFPKT